MTTRVSETRDPVILRAQPSIRATEHRSPAAQFMDQLLPVVAHAPLAKGSALQDVQVSQLFSYLFVDSVLSRFVVGHAKQVSEG